MRGVRGIQIGSNNNGWSKIFTFTGIESPLHSCWDKITVKNRRGTEGVPWREMGGSGTPGTLP